MLSVTPGTKVGVATGADERERVDHGRLLEVYIGAESELAVDTEEDGSAGVSVREPVKRGGTVVEDEESVAEASTDGDGVV